MPVTASLNQYATWDNGTALYADLEAAPSYGVIEGGRLQITRTLPSSGNLLVGRLLPMAFGGTLGSSGGPSRQLTQRYAGALASSALVLLGKIFTRSLGGSLGSSGTLARNSSWARIWTGTLGSSGGAVLRFQNRFYPSLGGTLGLLGRLGLCVNRNPPDLVPLPPVAAPPTCGAFPKPGAPLLVPIASQGAPPLAGDPDCAVTR